MLLLVQSHRGTEKRGPSLFWSRRRRAGRTLPLLLEQRRREREREEEPFSKNQKEEEEGSSSFLSFLCARRRLNPKTTEAAENAGSKTEKYFSHNFAARVVLKQLFKWFDREGKLSSNFMLQKVFTQIDRPKSSSL